MLLVTLKERLEEVLEELVGNKACVANKRALQGFDYNLLGMVYNLLGLAWIGLQNERGWLFIVCHLLNEWLGSL